MMNFTFRTTATALALSLALTGIPACDGVDEIEDDAFSADEREDDLEIETSGDREVLTLTVVAAGAALMFTLAGVLIHQSSQDELHALIQQGLTQSEFDKEWARLEQEAAAEAAAIQAESSKVAYNDGTHNVALRMTEFTAFLYNAQSYLSGPEYAASEFYEASIAAASQALMSGYMKDIRSLRRSVSDDSEKYGQGGCVVAKVQKREYEAATPIWYESWVRFHSAEDFIPKAAYASISATGKCVAWNPFVWSTFANWMREIWSNAKPLTLDNITHHGFNSGIFIALFAAHCVLPPKLAITSSAELCSGD